MRSPAVSLALLVILALGFGTAALADDGGSGKSTTTTTTAHDNRDGAKSPHTESTAEDTTETETTDTETETEIGTAPTETTTDAPADAPAPVLGASAAIQPVSGDVRVKLPGSNDYVPVSAAASVPMGAVIDATAGSIRLTSAHDAAGTRQSAVFHDGAFVLKGQTKGAAPVTELELTGGDFAKACGRSALARGAKHPPVRQLWGSGHGRFRTRGRYSAATVRGTIWLTRDSCDGTLTTVKRGVVSVRDAVRRKTVTVKAGHSYFARAPLPIKAATSLIGF